MPRYVAFLRAINVGGHTVKMDCLRRLFAGLGLAQVETFIASGNVIFRSGARDTGALERKIEKELARALGFEVATFLRTDAELAAIVGHRPFPQAEVDRAGAFCIGLLAAAMSAPAERKLLALTSPIDTFQVRGREVYWLCRKQQSESTFSNAVLEKTLGLRATFRNLRTMSSIAGKYPPQP